MNQEWSDSEVSQYEESEAVFFDEGCPNDRQFFWPRHGESLTCGIPRELNCLYDHDVSQEPTREPSQ